VKVDRFPITFALVVAILGVFLIEAMNGGSKNPETLYRLGAIVPTAFSSGEYWRLFTAMFLHVGVLHLTLNVWALYQLGSVFELMFGSTRFAVTYLVSGLIASTASAVLPPHGLAAGASGAIFGILGALIFSIRRSPHWRHQPWTRGFTQQLIGWAAINVVIGFTFPGIDNAAHIGGFLTGLALGLIPHRVPPPPPREYVIEVRDDGGGRPEA
jgi:rhomboid protease GluP